MSECCNTCKKKIFGDLDCCDCGCHTSQQEEGWEKQMDADFFEDEWALKTVEDKIFVNVEAVKKYFRNLLKSHQEEAIAKIEGLRKAWNDDAGTPQRYSREGFNAAIDQALSILKGEK